MLLVDLFGKKKLEDRILELEATLAGLQVMVPDQNLYAMPEFWETYR